MSCKKRQVGNATELCSQGTQTDVLKQEKRVGREKKELSRVKSYSQICVSRKEFPGGANEIGNSLRRRSKQDFCGNLNEIDGKVGNSQKSLRKLSREVENIEKLKETEQNSGVMLRKRVNSQPNLQLQENFNLRFMSETDLGAKNIELCDKNTPKSTKSKSNFLYAKKSKLIKLKKNSKESNKNPHEGKISSLSPKNHFSSLENSNTKKSTKTNYQYIKKQKITTQIPEFSKQNAIKGIIKSTNNADLKSFSRKFSTHSDHKVKFSNDFTDLQETTNKIDSPLITPNPTEPEEWINITQFTSFESNSEFVEEFKEKLQKSSERFKTFVKKQKSEESDFATGDSCELSSTKRVRSNSESENLEKKSQDSLQELLKYSTVNSKTSLIEFVNSTSKSSKLSGKQELSKDSQESQRAKPPLVKTASYQFNKSIYK